MTATLLGVVIAVIKGAFQWPITDYLIIIEAPILGLSFLLVGKGGATYTGMVNGILQSAIKVNFFPLDLVFGVLYGVTVDAFCTLLSVRGTEGVSAKRMITALILASAVTGVSITYAVITLDINLVPSMSGLTPSEILDIVYVPIVIWGIVSGALGGYLASRLWERNLKARFQHATVSQSQT
jgi:glucan phosphoethanolaminetransferase (alkaline phosphatase superfamily)